MMQQQQQSDSFDELRIIAKDACGLDGNDRDIIRLAADEIEQLYHLLSQTQAQLIETQRHEIAVGERLLAAMKREQELVAALKAPKFDAPQLMGSMSSGWLVCRENGK